MKIVGLMLVKEHSKRLSGKNTMDFHGKPMFLWNLEKCLTIFDEVYVSSDSYSILQLAALHGAKAIHRGEELCGDTPDIPVFQHAMENMDKEVEGIVAVHANNPSIDRNLIAMVKKSLEIGAPEVMTCGRMTKKTFYKKQSNPINGSVRGFHVMRLTHYNDPYHPEPEMLIVDDSMEIETIEDFNKITEKVTFNADDTKVTLSID